MPFLRRRAVCAFTFSLSVLSSLVLAAGCGSSSNNGTVSCGLACNGTQGLAPGGASSMYVLQMGLTPSQSVLQFATRVNGSVTPQGTLTLPYGFVSTGLAVDTSGNVYVAGVAGGPGEVLVYAAGATGAATPARTLTFTDFPHGVAVSGNSLFVATSISGVQVYQAGTTGSAAVVRSIAGTQTGMSPYASATATNLAADAAGNLYLSMGQSGSIGEVLVFAAGVSGNVAPMRVIPLQGYPYGVSVDAAGNTYASLNPGLNTAMPLIEEFGSGSTAIRTLTPTGTLSSLIGGVQVDAAGNVYAIEQQRGTNTVSFAVDEIAPSVTGSAAPTVQMTSGAFTNGEYFFAVR